MTAALANVMPGIPPIHLVYATEWIVGAAMLTTAVGVVAQRRLARRSIGSQVALVAVITVVAALAAVVVISICLLGGGDRKIMLELLGAAGLAGLAVALVIGRSVTRATKLLLVAVRGNTQALVPLFAVGVFIGFTLSQTGMVKHWYLERSRGSSGRSWVYRAIVNGVGAVLTFAVTIIELVSKFLAGAWLVAIVIPLLVLMFMAVQRAYARIGAELQIGQVPPRPVKRASLVIVPVTGMSRLTAEGISVAKSLGDDVIAVTVVFTDSDEDPAPEASFHDEWQAWNPGVQLLTLRSAHRSLADPIVHYLQLDLDYSLAQS